MNSKILGLGQWLGIHPGTEGTPVQSLVREDPTCRMATKATFHDYCAHTLEPVLRTRSPGTAESRPCWLLPQKAQVHNKDPAQSKKIKYINLKKRKEYQVCWNRLTKELHENHIGRRKRIRESIVQGCSRAEKSPLESRAERGFLELPLTCSQFMNMAVSKLLAAHLRRFADCAGVMYTSTHSAIRRVGNLKGGKKAHKYAFIQVGLSKYTHAAVHTPVLSVFILTINAA